MAPKHAILAITLSCSALAAAMTARAEPKPDFAGVRARVQDAIAGEALPSIAIAVSQGGKELWAEGFGWADRERKVAATADTLYSLASISKPVTATGLMVLVERGLVDLDAPANRYLGEAKLVARAGAADVATVRRLANHTAGLSVHYRFFYEDDALERPSMEDSIRRHGLLVTEPGAAMVYSNFGYGVIEHIIERVSGRSYARFMVDELFVPLGMQRAAVNREPDFGSGVAVRYARNGQPVPFYDFDHRGASAVFASARDLLRFGMFHLGDRVEGQRAILTPGTIREMQVRTAGSAAYGYGIGWGISDRFGLKAVSHSGSMAGVSTRLSLFPEKDIAVVLLSNGDSDSLRDIENAVLHALVPETIHRSHGFKPDAPFVGEWRGFIETPAKPVDVAITIEPAGRVFARVGDGERVEVDRVSLIEGVLWIEGVPGDLETEEAARYPYDLQFGLIAGGDTLSGGANAVSRPVPGRVGDALTYYAELHRKPAGPAPAGGSRLRSENQ